MKTNITHISIRLKYKYISKAHRFVKLRFEHEDRSQCSYHIRLLSHLSLNMFYLTEYLISVMQRELKHCYKSYHHASVCIARFDRNFATFSSFPTEIFLLD